MTNERKLELTLWGLYPYGLKMVNPENNTVWDFTIYTTKIHKHHLPLLHSLDKLTEPILEGGLIPLTELYKLWLVKTKRTDCTEYQLAFSFDYSSNLRKDWLPFWMFEKLKEWHFNIYDLPSEMYIEKSLTT